MDNCILSFSGKYCYKNDSHCNCGAACYDCGFWINTHTGDTAHCTNFYDYGIYINTTLAEGILYRWIWIWCTTLMHEKNKIGIYSGIDIYPQCHTYFVNVKSFVQSLETNWTINHF